MVFTRSAFSKLTSGAVKSLARCARSQTQGCKVAVRRQACHRSYTESDLLSLPVTDVGRVLAFFSCSLRSSLDAAVSGFFSSSCGLCLCKEPTLLILLLPGCRMTPTWVGRESGQVCVQPQDTERLTMQGLGGDSACQPPNLCL